MKRRSFLSTVASLAGATGSSSTNSSLAADGGKPIRRTPLRSTYYGPEYYDEKELAELRDVLYRRASPCKLRSCRSSRLSSKS
jgi:hypothetical protein